MKDIVDTVAKVIPFLQSSPTWVKYLFSIWLILTVILILAVIFTQKPKEQAQLNEDQKAEEKDTNSKPEMPSNSNTGLSSQGPTASISNSSNSTIYQAGRDIVVHPPQTGTDSRNATSSKSEEPPKPLQKFSISVEDISSPDEKLPYGLAIVIHTTVPISPVHIAVVFSGPIGRGNVYFTPPAGAAAFGSSMFNKVIRWEDNVFEFSFDSPPFTPRSPLEVKVFSVSKIKFVDVKSRD